MAVSVVTDGSSGGTTRLNYGDNNESCEGKDGFHRVWFPGDRAPRDQCAYRWWKILTYSAVARIQ